MARKSGVKKNPLKNSAVLWRINPFAKSVKRQGQRNAAQKKWTCDGGWSEVMEHVMVDGMFEGMFWLSCVCKYGSCLQMKSWVMTWSNVECGVHGWMLELLIHFDYCNNLLVISDNCWSMIWIVVELSIYWFSFSSILGPTTGPKGGGGLEFKD